MLTRPITAPLYSAFIPPPLPHTISLHLFFPELSLPFWSSSSAPALASRLGLLTRREALTCLRARNRSRIEGTIWAETPSSTAGRMGSSISTLRPMIHILRSWSLGSRSQGRRGDWECRRLKVLMPQSLLNQCLSEVLYMFCHSPNPTNVCVSSSYHKLKITWSFQGVTHVTPHIFTQH